MDRNDRFLIFSLFCVFLIAMSDNTEIESLKKEFENAAAKLKEAKERDATGSGISYIFIL